MSEANQKKSVGRVSRAATVVASSAAVGASWMALVAATTIGLGPVERVRTEVTADSSMLNGEGRYRLVVQSYARGDAASGLLPSNRQKPLASTQRAVTADELARGVSIDVLRVGEQPDDSRLIVAWIEQGEPDLEFDGAEARPGVGAFYGVAEPHATGGFTHVVLKTRA